MSGAEQTSGAKPWLWRPGQSGNPAGRPKGSRNKLAEDFLGALQRDFAEHGAQAIADCRRDDPAAYVRVVAGLLPREMHIKTSPLDGLTHDQLLRLADVLQGAVEAARAGLPVPMILEGEASDAE